MSTLEELERAALAGDQLAASELAHLLDAGEETSRNPQGAIKWYRLAADLGSKGAAYILGCKYRDGSDVDRDDAMALKWFEKSAELGNASAHIFLAIAYTDGLLGQAPDSDRARSHSKLADICAANEVAMHQARRERYRDRDGN